MYKIVAKLRVKKRWYWRNKFQVVGVSDPFEFVAISKQERLKVKATAISTIFSGEQNSILKGKHLTVVYLESI